jgi:tRNA nucleotidyltransferase (CCA-adding enzyme)
MPDLLELFCKYADSENLAGSSFLVGGTVRDIILNKQVRDLDVAVSGDALDIGRSFASEINASFVLLDEGFGIARVALLNKYIDICPVLNGSITDDLGARDLTINAMAIPLQSVCYPLSAVASGKIKAAIIDPFNGTGDIEKGIIRMVSEKNLISDPLRLLRIYRFAATLGFYIDPATARAVHEHAELISNPAAERIAEELKHILKCRTSAQIMKEMLASGILPAIFQGLAANSPDTWQDIWSAYEKAEHILADPSDYFGDASGSVIEYFNTAYRADCLKLSILSGNAGAAEKTSVRLRLSRKETEYIRMLFSDIEIISMIEITRRPVVMGLLRELDDNIYGILVYLLALGPKVMPEARTRALTKELIAIYQDEYIPAMRMLPLINGHDLISKFDLSPSPFFSDILSAIELFVLEGKVKTREDALRAAAEMIRNRVGPE